MLVAERREYLLARLHADGRVVAREVAQKLGLSEDSVRRDLRELADAGLCQRVYGGALPASPATANYDTRRTVEPDSKHRVARAAVRLIKPGNTVILDGGTTTLALVHSLPHDHKCTIVTHSPTVAVALLDHVDVDVYLLGGRLYKHSAVTCGAAAAEATHDISADLFFLGVTGIHPDEGLTTGDPEEAAMKRALARRAADTYILGSAEKIGTASQYRVLPFHATAGLITDAATSEVVLDLAATGLPILDAAAN